jgi:hypothetical protein
MRTVSQFNLTYVHIYMLIFCPVIILGSFGLSRNKWKAHIELKLKLSGSKDFVILYVVSM